MNLAPILVITLSRYKHFKECIESLAKNELSKDSVLYIALDYPLHEKHWDGYNSILSYIEMIGDDKLFKELIVLRRETNYGAVKNFNSALDTVFSKHENVIFSEDDNTFSLNYLDYMNKALDEFANHDEIFAVNGYNYPIKGLIQPISNYYTWTGFSAWGCGLWKEKYNKVDFSLESIKKSINNLNNCKRIDKIAGHLLPALVTNVRTNYMTTDTAICLHMVVNNLEAIFPTINKVRNHGHDGTGMHCHQVTDKFIMQELDDSLSFNQLLNDSNESIELRNQLKDYFKRTKVQTLKTIVKYLLFKIGI